MKNAKKCFLVLIAVILVLASLPIFAFAYTEADYNVNCNKDSSNRPIIDIRDYVRARTFLNVIPKFYSDEFMNNLKKILIGKEVIMDTGNESSSVISDTSSNDSGTIYLPEVP